ncbi:PEP-CTERM sorting domain-containing protein [Pirellulales bacterium]|nr:PEP-CTERM sorting domain-containing protein [Pirellulales bacterium]
MKLQNYFSSWTSLGLTSLVRPLVTTLAALALFVLVLTPTSQADLVSYWNFDDGATVTDQVGSNDGTTIHNAGFNAATPDGSPFSLDLTATGHPISGGGPDQDYVRIGPGANPADRNNDGDVDGFDLLVLQQADPSLIPNWESEFGMPGTPPGRDLGIAATNSFTIATWVNYTGSQRGIVTIKQDLTSGFGELQDRSGITLGIQSRRIFVGMIPSSGVDDALNGEGLNFRDMIARDLIVVFDEWHHIAATYDFASDQLTVYLDGVASADIRTDPSIVGVGNDGSNVTAGAGIDFIDTNGSFTGFGAAGNGPQDSTSAGDFTRHFYDGLLDDVAVWDNAIPASSIALLAAGTKPDQVPAFAAAAVIPEPGSLALAMLGLAGLVGRSLGQRPSRIPADSALGGSKGDPQKKRKCPNARVN